MSTALTPEFVFALEQRMRVIAAQTYPALLENLVYNRFTKELTSTGRKERLIWMLDTAGIDYVNALGNEVEYDNLVSNTVEYEAQAATKGFQINKNDLEDLDGGGVDAAAEWTRQVTTYAAYWPQKQIMKLIREGETAGHTSYDGEVFFSAAHPLNPFDDTVGTFSNLFTGGSGSGAFDKAPIDNSVTVDAAFQNLNRVIASIETIPMANGEDPRGLRAGMLIVPPALAGRAQQLTNARYIAQAAGSSGGGAAEVEAVVRNWNIGEPIVVPELAAAFGGSDTDYYIIPKQMTGDSLGAFVYVNRQPFEIVFNSPMTDKELNVANELHWTIRGRNITAYGHPYLAFKVKKT